MKKTILSALCALALIGCANQQRTDTATGGAGDEGRIDEPNREYSDKAEEAREDAPTVYDDQPHGTGGSPQVTTEDETPEMWETQPDQSRNDGPTMPGDEAQREDAQGGAGDAGSNVESDRPVIEEDAEGGSGEAGVEGKKRPLGGSGDAGTPAEERQREEIQDDTLMQ